jgi:hypothetical protein
MSVAVKLTRRELLRQLASTTLGLWLASAAGVAPVAARAPRPQAARSESGSLREYVMAFRASLPGENSYAFVDPTDGETVQMTAAVHSALSGDLPAAAGVLGQFGYDLVRFHDEAGGLDHLLLRERQPYTRCWGLYVLSQSPTARSLTIQAPHPLWDTFTAAFGVEAYLALDARHFFLAGAHRYANGPDSLVSDQARNPRSVFQRLHEALTEPGGLVLQYHGFNHKARPEYPSVVLSNGSPQAAPELYQLAAAIQAQSETAGVFDGQHWAMLGATQNPQARFSRSVGVHFIHAEHSYEIRSDPARRAALVEAARAAFFTS